MGQPVKLKEPKEQPNAKQRPESTGMPDEWNDAKNLNSFVLYPTADWQRVGDFFIGVYQGERTVSLDAGKGKTRESKVYDFSLPSDGDAMVSVWGTAALDRDMANAKQGRLTRIEYTGTVPSGKGNDTNVFDVRQK